MGHIPILLLFIFSDICSAQSLSILDSASKEPIPFATVLFIDKEKPTNGGYSDEDGKIKIDLANFERAEFSCIGYATKIISRDKLAAGSIYLEKISYQLEEVVVSDEAKSTDVGYVKPKSDYIVAAKREAQVVLLIDNADRREKTVKSFLFRGHTPKKYKTAFRIHFYTKDTLNGGPCEEMPHEDIVKYLKPGKPMRTIEVDVATYGIKLPVTGMYAGIEWLSSINTEGKALGDEDHEGWYSTIIEYNSDFDTAHTYVKYSLEDTEWILTTRGYNASFWIKVVRD